MSLATLYKEELKAAVRGRFDWLGGAVVLFSIGCIAAIATQDTWLDGYGVIAYFLVPMSFIPLAAGSIASPRANRFVESLFTAPVDRREWFTAKVMVLLTLALGYYIALVPMMLVYVAHVGMPLLLIKFTEWTPGILLVSVAVGTLIGVFFIGRSIAPPIATGVGILLAFAVLVPLQELLVARGYGATATGHLTLASPFVLLKNGLGFTLGANSIPTTTTLTWLCFGLIAIGAFALAAWVFLRAQGVESWEATPAQRWTIAIVIVALALIPVFFADTNYDSPAPLANNAPDIPGIFLRGGGNLALTEPGGVLPTKCCDTLLNRDQWPTFPIGNMTTQDLLVLLPVETTQPLKDLDIRAAGQNGLQVTVDTVAPAQMIQRLEMRTYPLGTGPAGPDGQHVRTGWVARIPITLTPTNPWDVGGVRYPLDVTATYSLPGEQQSHTLTMRAAIEAQIPDALVQMATVAAILPLLCLAAAYFRWRRTR
jgi:ABC-type transport system involved in multi-copper enzyme maturation permease subunit